MVMCNSYGYEYESKVLQTPDEETLVSEPHKDIMEICPSAIRSQVIVDQTIIGNRLSCGLWIQTAWWPLVLPINQN